MHSNDGHGIQPHITFHFQPAHHLSFPTACIIPPNFIRMWASFRIFASAYKQSTLKFHFNYKVL